MRETEKGNAAVPLLSGFLNQYEISLLIFSFIYYVIDITIIILLVLLLPLP